VIRPGTGGECSDRLLHGEDGAEPSRSLDNAVTSLIVHRGSLRGMANKTFGPKPRNSGYALSGIMQPSGPG